MCMCNVHVHVHVHLYVYVHLHVHVHIHVNVHMHVYEEVKENLFYLLWRAARKEGVYVVRSLQKLFWSN